jgi:hypothetical protein
MFDFKLEWIYILDQDFSYNIRGYLPDDFASGCAFEDASGVRRLELHSDGTVKVLATYAWDGCTPKFALWDITIGIPDGIPNLNTKRPKAYYASLMHDVLYQFLDNGLPISRESIDKIFLEILERDDFAPRRLYYLAVRLFGGLFRLFSRWKRNYKGKKVAL